MGIVYNNAIRNGGNMPKIQATTDINTITGIQNSMALDNVNAVLYYWDPVLVSWIALAGGAALDLQQVLNNGNSANASMNINGDNITINEGSLVSRDFNLNSRAIINAEGFTLQNYTGTQEICKLTWDQFATSFLRLKSISPGRTTLYPSSVAADITTTLPNTTGQLYNLVFAAITLVNGVGTYVVVGGVNNVVIGVIITNTNGSSTIGISYKYTAVANLITVTALKSNGGTEASDQSTLNVTIAI